MELISGFIGTYLRLSEDEEEQFQQALESMGLETKERVMEFATDWQEKGREQGKQEGLQEGQIRKGQDDIIRILEIRFKEDISPFLRGMIQRIDDLEVLGNLLEIAVTTQSLEAFEYEASQYVAS